MSPSVAAPSSFPRTLASIIDRHAPNDGEVPTAIGNLYLSRKSSTSQPLYTAQWPCFALVAQGAKSITLAAETYEYGVGDYLVVALDLPVTSVVTKATPALPNLGIGMAIDGARMRGLLDRVDLGSHAMSGARRGVAVNRASPELLDATLRLVALLDRPEEIPVMAPLIEEEILYRLLIGPFGSRLLQIATSESPSNKVVKAVAWLRKHFTGQLRVADLARRVGMSASSFHPHFKAMTGMTPLQYQKQLRLHEARRLMLVERLDAATAGYHVGYQSPSQFSREYSRLYGRSPQRDIQAIRTPKATT